MNCVTFQSVPYIAHVDTGVLCDEVRNFLLQIHQIKSRALLHIKKADISKDLLNKNVLSICLNNSMDPASLVSGSSNSDLRPRKNVVCVCVDVYTHVR